VVGKKSMMTNIIVKRVIEGLRAGSKIESGEHLDKDEVHE
jgi:hypothetical protein